MIAWISRTESGLKCQQWNKQSPHSHFYTTLDPFPDEKFYYVRNYCRNPDGYRRRPWCYTTDPNIEWQYCHVAHCEYRMTIL